MIKYLVNRAYQLNNQIKYNIQQCELLALKWLIEDSMAQLLQCGGKDTVVEDVIPDDFVCTVPAKMKVGDRITIQPQFIPSNTTNTNTTCTSNNPELLSVKTYGTRHELTALNTGIVVIAITSAVKPSITHKYTITIEAAPVVKQDQIYYGVIPVSLGIRQFSDITADMITANLTRVTATTLDKTAVDFMSAGDLVVVAVPTGRTATVDDGFGGKMEFTTSAKNPNTGQPIVSNGEVVVTIDDVKYYLYGAFMTLNSGTLFIYVD